MLKSTIIEIDGTFLGTAILDRDGDTRRFYAAHESVRSLHNRTVASLAVLRHQVAGRYHHASTDGALVSPACR